MSADKHSRISKWLTAIIAALILFVSGVGILHLNPYWRPEPTNPAVIDHRVHLWNGLGHIVSALGLLCFFAILTSAVALALARVVRTKWLYSATAIVVVCTVAVFLAASGLWREYSADFRWQRGAGLTGFTLSFEGHAANPVWQKIVRWQVEPELDGSLRGGTLQRADGSVGVSVLKLIPIAAPTAFGSDGIVLHSVERKRP